MTENDPGPLRTATRFDVISVDGTTIAVWVDGRGPALVMFHGALNDHSTYGPLVAALRSDLTMYLVDRRGRGASGDGPRYAIEREFEDVAAVVDAVADRADGPVALWGHSYGADCVMGGAARTTKLRRLILYEPGLQYAYPPGSIEKIEARVEAGDREGAMVALLIDVLELNDEEVAEIKSSSLWPTRVSYVPTLPRELRAEATWRYEPGQFEAVTIPTMLLAGSESPAEQQLATRLAAASIPNAIIRVMEGHAHLAHQTDPAMVATIVREFVGS